MLTAGAAQTIVEGASRHARRAVALRRQRSARARLPRPAPALRRQRRRRARGGAGAGRRDVLQRWPQRHRGNCRFFATRSATARSSCGGVFPSATGRIVVRAEGRERVEAVVHAAVDDDWRVLAGTEETVEVDALCLGYGFFPSVELIRVAGCELRYDEALGGPVAVVDRWQRTSVPGVSRQATERASEARTRPRTGAARGARASRGRGARGADPAAARAKRLASSGRSPHVPRRARDLRAHRRPTPSSAAARSCAATSSTGRSRRRPTSMSSRPSPVSRWASARGATASGRSRR